MLQNRATVTNGCLTDIEFEEFAIALLIAEEIGGDCTHGVTVLHHIPALPIRLLDDAAGRLGNCQRPTGQDQPVTVELATVGLQAAEVRLKDPVFLLRVSVERESAAGQGVARSDCLQDLVVPVVRVLAAALRVHFPLHRQWNSRPALAHRRQVLSGGLKHHLVRRAGLDDGRGREDARA